ncbi:MAG: glycosyltransferase family 4 protein [Candidatus Omnitrophica bacterium]|nr:glycosyltransferase family 4 protein [Candidatus Omnitrophota bacterium]
MKTIRVLHVIKTLSLGGAETNLFNLVSAMGRGEHHVAYSFGGQIESRFKKRGVRLYKYADGSHKIKSLATPLVVGRLARYILANDIRVVHTHIFNAHVWGALAAKLTGRKLVEHVHDFRYIDRAARESGRCFVDQYRYAEKMKNVSDGVILLTEQNREYVLAHRLCAPEKVWLIRNGIRIAGPGAPTPDGVRERLALPPGGPVFLTPARMSPEKNINLLFEVVPRVVRECPQARFLAVGDGPFLETYRRKAVGEGLEAYLRFTGFEPDIRGLLGVSTAFVLPSFLELHPVSLLEALSMKVPAVVSESAGCNREVLTHGKNAFLLDPHSPDEWAAVLVGLARDPGLGRAMGEEGYELCRREFDIEKTAARIGGVYEKVLAGPS